MKKSEIFNIPNILSMIRLLLVGVLIYFFSLDRYIPALIVYVTAGITDVIDGYIARKYNMITPLGKLLDPVADKLMLLSALLCMFSKGIISSQIMILIFVKEALLVIGGWILLRIKNVVVEANIFGKVTTVMFFCSVILAFLHDYVQPLDAYFLYGSTILAIIALLQYSYKYIFHTQSEPS